MPSKMLDRFYLKKNRTSKIKLGLMSIPAEIRCLIYPHVATPLYSPITNYIGLLLSCKTIANEISHQYTKEADRIVEEEIGPKLNRCLMLAVRESVDYCGFMHMEVWFPRWVLCPQRDFFLRNMLNSLHRVLKLHLCTLTFGIFETFPAPWGRSGNGLKYIRMNDADVVLRTEESYLQDRANGENWVTHGSVDEDDEEDSQNESSHDTEDDFGEDYGWEELPSRNFLQMPQGRQQSQYRIHTTYENIAPLACRINCLLAPELCRSHKHMYWHDACQIRAPHLLRYHIVSHVNVRQVILTLKELDRTEDLSNSRVYPLGVSYLRIDPRNERFTMRRWGWEMEGEWHKGGESDKQDVPKTIVWTKVEPGRVAHAAYRAQDFLVDWRLLAVKRIWSS